MGTRPYADVRDRRREENIPEQLNKSDNWAETSFSREVMNVVKRNNTSYKKAVRESDSDESGSNSDLDDMLDEALEAESEGPTPPKQNKHGNSLSSTSFVYQESRFKSPLKPSAPATPATPAARPDRGAELVHSVSFYRRMQGQSSTPSTPMRVVRHTSPERDPPAESAASVTTVRQRIKELQSEIAKQQTVISQVPCSFTSL
ncbi:anillin-like, partial [Hyposmocoma kahamanoa]|uniref:anillin-like n=1 Tax=Hyposmocoma kahamanoa TaxID=1477025 RepID=UPI000E6D9E61